MNRNNYFIHFGIAVVIITLAAVLGQIRRWETSLTVSRTKLDPVTTATTVAPSESSGVVNAEAEVLVRFKPGVSIDQIKKIAAVNNDLVDDKYEAIKGLVSIDDMDDADPEAVAREYASMVDLVEYAQPNFEISIERLEAGAPNDPQFEEQWALNNLGPKSASRRADIDALLAWTKTHGSEDVVVAVLDTGVDYTHEDLVSNMWTRPDSIPEYADEELGSFDDVHGFDAEMNDPDPMDDNGHGTHCAGIIGAEGDNGLGIAGINWKVQIMPLKFLGKGGFGTTKNAIEAINYAIDRKKKGVNIRVINASWGSTQYSRALEDAIRAAGDNGILFVAAAGNSSTDNDRRAHYPSNYNLPNVISVAAMDRTDALASFSNYGAKTVHIAAPGRDIKSTWLNDSYREASGTSMATPQVSGVAALIISSEPNISVEKLRDRILKSADKLDSVDGKVATGGLCATGALGITESH